MSIEFFLRMKKKVFNEKILLNVVEKFFGDSPKVNNEDETVLVIDLFNSEVGIIICLIKESTPYPYNIYESVILNNYFEDEQVIAIDFNKENEFLNNSYEIAFKFIFLLMENCNTEALLTSTFSEDILYFSDGNDVYINRNIPFINEQILKKINSTKNIIFGNV